MHLRRILHTDFEKVLRSEDKLPGRPQQRGAGAYTLCERCNSLTGKWYGGAYADWVHQAMRVIIDTRGRPPLIYPFDLFPLTVVKQVVPLFQKHQPDLVRFVLNRDSRVFPAHVRVYAFYTFSDRSRVAGMTGLMRGLDGTNSSAHVFSEVTFPPVGFVMTLDSPPPVAGLCEISSFSQFEYRDRRTAISMKLPIMPIYTAFPGDYRTRDQTLTDFQASKQYETQLLDSDHFCAGVPKRATVNGGGYGALMTLKGRLRQLKRNPKPCHD